MPRSACIALLASVGACVVAGVFGAARAQSLTATPEGTLKTQGLSVIIDQNPFSPIFLDKKNAGIQIVLDGDRLATDGAVRLDATPEQWARVPAFVSSTKDSYRAY